MNQITDIELIRFRPPSPSISTICSDGVLHGRRVPPVLRIIFNFLSTETAKNIRAVMASILRRNEEVLGRNLVYNPGHFENYSDCMNKPLHVLFVPLIAIYWRDKFYDPEN